MSMALRIRKVRELSGMRQAEVAALLNITQQAYFGLEQGADNAKLETLRRFCRVMNVDLSYLVCDEIPVTEETLSKYGRIGFSEVVNRYEKAQQQVELLQGIHNHLTNEVQQN